MGTLYPALMRLEQRGLLRHVGTTETNRKRGSALTAAGASWRRNKQAWGSDGGHHARAAARRGLKGPS
jgi:DNA-binding PadR family transcriptional regulator